MTHVTTAPAHKDGLQTFVPILIPTPTSRPTSSALIGKGKLQTTEHKNELTFTLKQSPTFAFTFSTFSIPLPAFCQSPRTYVPSPDPPGAAPNSPVTVVLFRDTDFRLHDNPALHHAEGLIATLVLRPAKPTKLWECCVCDLRHRLAQLQCQLHVRDDRLRAVADFCEEVNATRLNYNRHGDCNSIRDGNRKSSGIDGMDTEKIKVSSYWTSFLLNPDELPFSMKTLPKDVDDYGRLTRSIKIPLPLPPPKSINSVRASFLGHNDVGHEHCSSTTATFSGESLALRKLTNYIDGKSVVAGTDHDSNHNEEDENIIDTKFGRLDRLLSHGCLSPRLMWHQVMRQVSQYNVRRYCTEFELVFRDFVALTALNSTSSASAFYSGADVKQSNKCLGTA